ncbi:MAG: glycosyltransferase [Crocinitomicaceae bacterium]|nr:glycosyltransferase [Crocinitomicaceae bacterium]
MTKNVLYLSYDGMTDPLGQSQVLPYIIGLSKKGYKFHLVSFEKPNRYTQNRKVIERLCSENEIEWHPLMYTKRPPLLSTIWDVRKMKRISKKIHKKYQVEMVHCRSYISALVALSFKKKYRIPFLFDMRGFWADERVDGKIWNLNNPIYRVVYQFFKKKEVEFLVMSDHIISLTSAGKAEILTWNVLNDSDDKIQVIPCCVDTEKFRHDVVTEIEKQKIRSNLDIQENQYVLGYVGSIGTWYMLEEMLIFFKRYTKNKEKPLFLFVTKESPDLVRNTALKLGVDSNSVKIVSALHHEMPSYMSLFTCAVFFILPAYSKKASSPTKQGELMSMGIPIICNDGVGDTADLIRKYNAGSVIPSEEILTYDLSESNFDRNQAIEGAKSYFGLQNGVNAYFTVYKKIMF